MILSEKRQRLRTGQTTDTPYKGCPVSSPSVRTGGKQKKMRRARMDFEMTENEATTLRDKLLAHRARLLDHADQQVDADPHTRGWLRMLGDVRLALTALEEETRQ